MKKVYDINNEKVEVGDLLLVAKVGRLQKHIVLGFSKQCVILSCTRGRGKWQRPINGGNYEFVVTEYSDKAPILYRDNLDYTKHNSKQYIQYVPDVLIIKKNFGIPENLCKFVK